MSFVTSVKTFEYKQLLDVLKETRGYWELREEALDWTLENSLWKRLWTCRKTDDGMNIEVARGRRRRACFNFELRS